MLQSLFKKIDSIFDTTPMYRVVVYSLSAMAGYAIILSFLHILSYNGFFLMLSLVLLVCTAYGVNEICSFCTKVPAHPDSAVITALILFFLLSPLRTFSDALFLALAAAVAMLSKYLFAVRHRQIFNPAAFSAVVIGLSGGGVLWWVGSLVMLPATIFVGYCVIKKIRRVDLFVSALIAGALPSLVFGLTSGLQSVDILFQYIVSSPIIFFASVMVTEPLTTPPTRELRILYGAFIGVFSNIPLHVGRVYFTPELALVLGNIFSYAVSIHERLHLRLTEKKCIAQDTYEFVFQNRSVPPFSPGQYLEWTLPHDHPDARGIRRYFTIASSPTEPAIRLSTKFFTPSSSFKKKLNALTVGESIWATQLCGDFTLPVDEKKKLGFIAGGIGITPFRSMIQYLIHTKSRRDVILFYQNKTPQDIAYKELCDRGKTAFDLRTVYLVSTAGQSPWNGEVGYLTAEILRKYAADVLERLWYLSGPSSMVSSYKKILIGMGVKKEHILTDYFPGFA